MTIKEAEHLFDENYVCGGGSHRYIEEETIENCTIQILQCSECGELSIGWIRTKKENKNENTI